MKANLFRMMALMVAGVMLAGIIPAYADDPPEEPALPPADQYRWRDPDVVTRDWGDTDPVRWDRWTAEWVYNEGDEKWEVGEYTLADSPAPGIPGDNHVVVFNTGATSAYTVRLTQSYNFEADTHDTGFMVGTDKVILDLNGFNLTLPVLEGVETKNFVLGGSGITSDLTIQGGGTFTAWNLDVSDGGTSALTLIGTVSTPTILEFEAEGNSPTARRAFWGAGTLDIRDNARLITNQGTTFNSTIITIDDGGTLETNDQFRVMATIHVNAGGHIQINKQVQMGRNAPGTINVNTGGTVDSDRLDLAVRGDGSTINILDGGVWTTRSMLERSREGDNRKVTDVLIEGDDGNGQASLLKVNEDARLGVATTDGTPRTNDRTHLTVRDGGRYEVTNQLDLTFMSQVAIDNGTISVGALVVQDGAEINEEMYRARYVLTLHESMIEAPALFQVGGDAQIASEAGAADHWEFSFELAEGFTPEIGDEFAVLSYGGKLTGYFVGKAPNSPNYTFWQDDVQYQLDYGTGEESAITLTVIPEPHTLGLLLAAGALLALRRRKRGM